MDEELFTFSSDSGKYFPGWDMAVIDEHNLAILNEVYSIPGTKREVLLFSESGSVVKRLGGPNYGFSSSVSNQMLFLTDSTFLFTHNISHFAGDDIPQLIKMGLDGQIDWIYDFPKYWYDDSIGSIGISELTLSGKGDIIIAGVRRRSNDLGTGNDFYVSKMTNDGQVLWEHFYNTPINTSTQEYSYNYVQDVQELADQSILVMGGSFHHDDIIILRVDSTGCLNGYDCAKTEIIIHDGASQVKDEGSEINKVIVKPNPTNGILNVMFPGYCTGSCQVINSKGIIIKNMSFDQQDEVILSIHEVPPGIYYLQIRTVDGVYVNKVVKY